MGHGSMDRLVFGVNSHEKNNLVAFWCDEVPADWHGHRNDSDAGLKILKQQLQALNLRSCLLAVAYLGGAVAIVLRATLEPQRL